RQFADIYLAHSWEDRTRLQATTFFSGQLADTKDWNYGSRFYEKVSNGGTVGIGADLGFNNKLGRTNLVAEYNRPYWDYAWAAYFNAKRDRIGARHTADLTSTTSMTLEGSLNNYSLAEPVEDQGFRSASDDLAQTGLIRASFIHQLQPKTANQPYIGVSYGFD
ncbi:MAG: hypothetical protein B7X02_03215, partial [Rhodospirillales bacterium 12-54-5]